MLQEIYDHLGGFPIWTHEMGSGKIMNRIRAHAAPKFPLMPTKEEASADYKAAAAKALLAYGETVEVERGALTRDVSPIQTLEDMAPGKPVVVAVIPDEKE